jgi:hypothetical protein
MSGHIIPIVQKRKVDFATLANNATQDVILADRIDLVHWREVTMMVRVSEHTLNNGAGSITLSVLMQSWTAEDPSVVFLGTLAQPADIVINSSSPLAPYYATISLPMTGDIDCMTAMARIIARGSRSNAGALTATFSIEFSAKDV